MNSMQMVCFIPAVVLLATFHHGLGEMVESAVYLLVGTDEIFSDSRFGLETASVDDPMACARQCLHYNGQLPCISFDLTPSGDSWKCDLYYSLTLGGSGDLNPYPGGLYHVLVPPRYDYLGCGAELPSPNALTPLGLVGTTPQHLIAKCATLMHGFLSEIRVFYIRSYSGEYFCVYSLGGATESDVTTVLNSGGDCDSGLGGVDAAYYIFRN